MAMDGFFGLDAGPLKADTGTLFGANRHACRNPDALQLKTLAMLSSMPCDPARSQSCCSF